jgi:hypothetical protein
MKRFLSWFRGPAGGLIALGLVARFNQFEGISWFAFVAAIGDGGNHGFEGDFGKEICCAAERRGTRTA